jgi:hypothetical protein
MIKPFFIGILLVISSCGGMKDAKNHGSIDSQTADKSFRLKPFSMVVVSKDNFAKAKKRYVDQLIPDTLTIRKINGVIKIPINQPNFIDTVFFRDSLGDIDEASQQEYNYLGYFPSVNMYLVEGLFWENYACFLIDKESGHQTSTWNRPYLSPKGRYFANLTMTYGLENMPNGIQIWRVEKGYSYLMKYFELDQQIWAPEDFAWETDHSLILRVVSTEKYFNNNGSPHEKDFYYLRIQF